MNRTIKHPLIVKLLYLLIYISALLITQPVSADEEYGRYRAIVLNEGGRSKLSSSVIPRVFIIDSKEGHMWTLDQKTKLPDPKIDFSLGTILTYQGRVRPGKKMGDIVDQAPTW